jgi:D-aminoacyl-tRNA deacylase
MSMIALIQRVARAEVRVAGESVGAIGPGLLALVAVEPGDGDAQVARMAQRLLGYRVFADAEGRHEPVAGRHRRRPAAGQPVHAGRRHAQGHAPSFTSAAPPEDGLNAGSTGWKPAVRFTRGGWKPAASVPIWVSLVNDGPVTFWLKA